MKWILAVIITLGTLLSSLNSQLNRFNEQNNPDNDKTLSPYFLVKSENPDVDKLPLYMTKADVKIAGVIADVTVTQIYKNTGKSPLEAIYVFPASSKAAVYGMTMTIGERILKAEIQERKKARETYEQAKKDGKSASLLEQERPNVFQMNIANIIPGDSIIVELKYTELLVPTDKTYEFVYPTVVGPRYSNKPAEGAKETDKFVDSPYQHEKEKPSYKFDINIDITTGVPIQEITCATHKLNVEKISANQAKVELDKSDEFAGNKDFILKYSLCGNNIETGLLLSEINGEKFFLLMLQPPKKIESDNIPPREYIFVMDVSGSMHGFPLDVSKSIINELLTGMKPGDKFNILFFSGGSSMLFEKSLEATIDNLSKASDMLDKLQGGGGTELLPALKKVFEYPKVQGYSRSIVIVTDGYVAVETEAFELIRNNLNDANVFAFGIGSAVNRFLIDGIARAGQGESFIVTNSEESKEISEKFRKYIASPVMTDIKVEYDRFDPYDIEPKSIPDVFSDRPIIIFGKYKDNAEGNIRVSGMYGKKYYHVDVDVRKFVSIVNGEALKYLWARNKIAVLNDYSSIFRKSALEPEITGLGLKYNLLTEYTSFVAVDYIKRNNGDSIVTVKQALPIPEGVSDRAVGNAMYMSVERSMSGGSSGNSNPLMPQSTPSSFIGKLKTAILADSEIDIEAEEIQLESEPIIDTTSIKKNINYPELARRAKIEGKVVVRALIDKSGNAINPSVEFTDNTILDSAAIKAVLKTKFVPGLSGGKPKDSWVTIPVEFKIKNATGLKIETTKEGNESKIKVGDIITIKFKYSVSIPYGSPDTWSKPYQLRFEYGTDKKYDLVNKWFEDMEIGEIRKIVVYHDKLFEIEKLLGIEEGKSNFNFEIELMKIE